MSALALVSAATHVRVVEAKRERRENENQNIEKEVGWQLKRRSHFFFGNERFLVHRLDFIHRRLRGSEVLVGVLKDKYRQKDSLPGARMHCSLPSHAERTKRKAELEGHH